MHHSMDILLLNPNARAIIAIYEPEPEESKKNPNNRTMFKTLDSTIKVGDMVIVPTTTRHNMTTMKVVEVDSEPDYDSNKKIDWVIGKLDLQKYNQLVATEEEGIRKIKTKEQERKREKLRQDLGIADEDMKKLPMAVINANAVEVEG